MAYSNRRSMGADTNKGRHQNKNWEVIEQIHKLFNYGFVTRKSVGDKTLYQVWMLTKNRPQNSPTLDREQFLKDNPPKVIYEKLSKVDDYEQIFFDPKWRNFHKSKHYDLQVIPTTIENFDEFNIKFSRNDDCYFNNSKAYSVAKKDTVENYLKHLLKKEELDEFIYTSYWWEENTK